MSISFRKLNMVVYSEPNSGGAFIDWLLQELVKCKQITALYVNIFTYSHPPAGENKAHGTKKINSPNAVNQVGKQQ